MQSMERAMTGRRRPVMAVLAPLRRFVLSDRPWPVADLMRPLRKILVSDFRQWPVDDRSYSIETLTTHARATFVREGDVYVMLQTGEICLADDADLARPWKSLGDPFQSQGRPRRPGPSCVFASSDGVVFASTTDGMTYRSANAGRTWETSLAVTVWRMAEDDGGGLYAGNYDAGKETGATLYKSDDGGRSWRVVFQDRRAQHVHTARWDEREKRLYVAFGDDLRRRGQACSDDRGGRFRVLARGRTHGHTDVAFTPHYIIWGSDDDTGRVYRVRRGEDSAEAVTGHAQHIWFVVARDEQLYVGTWAQTESDAPAAAVLASHDEGESWQKLLPLGTVVGRGLGFGSESRELSVNGWLYFSGGGRSYRVRRTANGAAAGQPVQARRAESP